MKDIFSESNVEAALMFLKDTDEEYGRLKGRVMGLGKNKDVIFGSEYLEAEGTVDERKGIAHNSTAYKQWLESYEEAETDLAILTAKRNTKIAFIEVFRSVYSARKRGNI